jgi:hypothetical protein
MPNSEDRDDGKLRSFLSSIMTTAKMWALEPQRFAIEGVIPLGDNQYEDGARLGVVIALYGPSGIGKTYLLISWLMSLVTGIKWCGRAAKKTFVLYYTDEGLRGIGTRERGWCTRWGWKGDPPEFHHCIKMLDLLDDEEVEIVGREIASWPEPYRPGLIAIDTFGSATSGGDEVKDMPRAMTNARRLSILTGAVVLLNHHPDKGGKWERGGGQFRNRLDLLIEIEMVPKAGEFRQLTFHKVRDDKKPEVMLVEYCEQAVETTWGPRTTLVVEGPRNWTDLPKAAGLEGAIREAVRGVFWNAPGRAAIWTELYRVADVATVGWRKKMGAHLDKSLFSRVVEGMVGSGEVRDEAAGMEPRPKGARLWWVEMQPGTPDGRSGGSLEDRLVELLPKGSNSLPTDLPTKDRLVEPILPISTDTYPEVANSDHGCMNGQPAPTLIPEGGSVSDLIGRARGQLPTSKDQGESPTKPR